MQFPATGHRLIAAELTQPTPGTHDVLLQVRACGVCRTDLHIVDRELPQRKCPVIPGHEIVGIVVERGAQARRFELGQRVGVPWLAGTCGNCDYCRSERENLCAAARFTGYDVDGGYAQFALADERFCFAIPAEYSDVEAAPLLCAGLIGYRALRAAGPARRLGIYGFGAAAHIVAQIARFEDREVFAFTRPGDLTAQRFARELGAAWAGGSDEAPPQPLDGAILFAPVGALVPAALRATVPGSTIVCAGIHMTAIPSFDYRDLWGERILRSVANLTRRDGSEFFQLAPRVPIRTAVETFPLERANDALQRLRDGQINGAAVLQCG
ncbi:MAG: zinc-dependent alcohol dehydrogenase family protein [Steroidobacteraceae bacterium]|nr:zinc-dependent alcohol dehydrogenase family protein [Steroidobacteraceae bacterium]